MGTRAELLRRLGAFGALPVLSALSPLVALPILARLATIDEWSAIAIGQSVGAIGAIALSAGWSVTGAAIAAQASELGRRDLLVESLGSRLTSATVAVPVAAGAAYAIADGSPLAALSAIAMTLTGFSIAWYAVGTGQARALAVVETIPRVAVNIGAAAVAEAFHQIVIYPIATGAIALVPVVGYYLAMTRDVRPAGWIWQGWHRIRANAAATAAEIVAAAYSMGATAIVGLAANASVVAHFNVGYRLASLGSIAIAAVSNSLQGWTAEARGDQFRRRIRLAAWALLAVGVAGLIGLALLGPWMARVLFGESLAPSREILAWLGAFFLIWSLETLTGRLILAARGRTRTLLVTTAAGSVVGIGLIYLLGRWHGATGAAAGLTLALGLIVLLQMPPAWESYRRDS